ncbi:tyrosine-type recombinase/integrase [Paenibacillus cymbidii]|uniref:tyrosine-type recombinase/integrase n=1 Tax=Paenibacillus cymbidii TaxID=1639034 RepID=UPI0010817847|nr:tyrosine-type recombinase/integrase [Paenibacillus cymbidii]
MKVVQPIRDQAVIDGFKQYLKLRSLRNYLLFCFGIYSGLRVSDLLELRVGMVRGKHVKMTERKNIHDKMFIIHPSIRAELDDYIADKGDDEYLFPSRQIKKNEPIRNQPIHRSTAYRMLNRAAKEFRLNSVGTHTMRKTWGYQLVKNAKPSESAVVLSLLMKMFGHRDPGYTLDYIGMTQDMMDEAISKLS